MVTSAGPASGRGTTVPASGLTQAVPGSQVEDPVAAVPKERVPDQSEAPICSELGKSDIPSGKQ